jgi:hypothetical protein
MLRNSEERQGSLVLFVETVTPPRYAKQRLHSHLAPRRCVGVAASRFPGAALAGCASAPFNAQKLQSSGAARQGFKQSD